MPRLFDWLVSGDPSATIAAVGTFVAALAALVVALRRQSHREHKAAREATAAQFVVLHDQLNGNGLISIALANMARDLDAIKRKLGIE